MSESTDPYIAALLREREGYVQFGRPERVKDVDAELARRGYKFPEPEPKKSTPKPVKRQQTRDS